jgi:hypothetical protein
MRKISILVLIIAIAISLLGCSQKADEPENAESSAPPESSFSAGKTDTELPADDESAAATESAITGADEPDATADEQMAGSQVQAKTTDNKPSGDSSEPPKQTNPPTPSQPKEPDPPKPTEPAKPTKPKTAYDAPYDTDKIIKDAKAYGESIGMTWSPSLTLDNCSWEAPGQTSGTLSGERLKTAIETCIRRVMKLQKDNEYQPGEFHFKLYLEPAGGGEYSFYLLMG